MAIPQVRQAVSSEREAVRNTLTLAFAADPFNRFYLPDAHRFLTYFPQIADAFVVTAMEAGTCFVTSNLEGVALWLEDLIFSKAQLRLGDGAFFETDV